MTPANFNAFCAALPHTHFVEQWGGAQVWKVGGPMGKMFAIGWFDGGARFTFKCSPMSFEMLKSAPGCCPAPYLASRGMLWIQRTSTETLSDVDLKTYLRESHKLAGQNLPKTVQRTLGLLA